MGDDLFHDAINEEGEGQELVPAVGSSRHKGEEDHQGTGCLEEASAIDEVFAPSDNHDPYDTGPIEPREMPLLLTGHFKPGSPFDDSL